ncbi:MAG TPA: hypothetical protein VMT03_10435 [Polyangia bacterium]|nr:hypothetical protein [Polyangia bacterium]
MRRTWAIGLLACAVVSCGGGGDSPGAGANNTGTGNCGKVEPCGGSVVGTWKANATCLDQTVVTMSFQSGLMGACPTATATNTPGAATGTLTLNSDLTYSMALTVPFEVSFAIPAACTGGMTCTAFAAGVSQAVGAGSTVTCTGTGDCACLMTTAADLSGTGVYSTSGTMLSFDYSDGSSNSGDYCVQGNTLHMVDVDTTMNMGPMGQATIKDDLTLTKQ